MLLVFVGQATASIAVPGQNAMPCQMDMADMSMSEMADMTSAEMDCCDQDCSCPIGGCASAALPASVAIIANNSYPTKIAQSPAAFLDQTPSSLYRPPILG